MNKFPFVLFFGPFATLSSTDGTVISNDAFPENP
jgi:hypothetical protein